MKKILPLNIEGFEFKDLSEKAKEKVINDQINFWLEVREYNEENKGNYEKAIDKAEQMQTPWFTGSYVYDYCKDELIEEIEANDYLFDEAGELLPLTYHMSPNNTVMFITYQLTKQKSIEVTLQ